MFKKTAVAVGLAMVAGTGIAIAQSNSSSMDNGSAMSSNGMSSNQMSSSRTTASHRMSSNRMASNQMSSNDMSSNRMSADQLQNSKKLPSSSSAARQLFDRLDTNHDDVLSQREASADNQISKLYDSMDTSETISKKAKRPGGITFDQFEAGLQAAQHNGAVGQAVSPGGNSRAHSAMSSMQSGAENRMSEMRRNTMSRGSQMGHNMRTNSMHQLQRAGNTMSNGGDSMQSNQMQE